MQLFRTSLPVALAAGLLSAGGAQATPAAPGIAELQAAYDAAEQQSPTSHTRGLRIVGSDCEAAASGRFSCQIGFRLPDDAEERVYLDAALVEAADGPWKLINGLCQRY